MSDETLSNAIKDFKRSVEITRDVRFQANLRLAKRQRSSSYIVSFLSLYVIALSLLPNIIKLEAFQNQLLLACSIVLSVFVIFTSLIDAAQNFYHQGELLHQCARKIATVNHALKNVSVDADPDKARSELERLQADYQKALDDCPINHENVDFYREIANKPHLFPSYYSRGFQVPIALWYNLKSLAMSYSWMFIHIIAIITISLVVYNYVIKTASFVKDTMP